MNIIFMGTPDFAVPTLEKVYNQGVNISLVVTQPDKRRGRGKRVKSTPVKKKANELGLEVYQPKNINDKDSINLIKSIQPDIIVVIAYGQILKKEILKIPQYGCVNVHASLLPKYRGAAPINWAIINGDTKTGITTMFMEEGLDTGDMILKQEINIEENETAGELHDKLMYIGAKLMIKTLKLIKNNKIKRIPQDDDMSSYAPMMNKKLGLINWDKRAEEIKNLVRGTNPWPGAYLNYKGKKVKVFKVDICNKLKDKKVGKVVKADNTGIYINARDKCVIIKELQFPSKKRMKIDQFILGNDFEVGINLV